MGRSHSGSVRERVRGKGLYCLDADYEARRGEILGALSRLSDRDLVVVSCVTILDGARCQSEQLASIRVQTLPPDDLLIADDASADASVEIAQKCARESVFRVRILRKPSGSHGANLGRLLAESWGDILLLSDQDDVWHPSKIKEVVSAMALMPRASGILCDSMLVDAHGHRLEGSYWSTLGFSPAEQMAFERGGGLAVIARRNVVPVHALELRRSSLPLLQPIECPRLPDWCIALLLAAEQSLFPLPETLGAYRLHPENAVGLRSRQGIVQRLSRPGREGRSREDALLVSSVIARLDERRPGLLGSRDRSFLEGKATHAFERATLPDRRCHGVFPVANALLAGRYRCYSNGWRSALVDVLGDS